jgi:hypothetical protein
VTTRRRPRTATSAGAQLRYIRSDEAGDLSLIQPGRRQPSERFFQRVEDIGALLVEFAESSNSALHHA